MKKFFAMLVAVLFLGCASMPKQAADVLACDAVDAVALEAIEAACDKACAAQDEVSKDFCATACNFLAKTGKDMVQDKVK